MLEKQKKWCQDKIEKGKEFVDKNRFWIGYGAGACAVFGGMYLSNKIFETNEGVISVGISESTGKPVICTRGLSRFGGYINSGPWMTIDSSDAERIAAYVSNHGDKKSD